MSADSTRIEGVSARYAAQIRELIYEQAVKRLKARQEAQRAQAAAIRDAVEKARTESEQRPAPQAAQPPAAEKPQRAEPAPRSEPAQSSEKTTGVIVDTRA